MKKILQNDMKILALPIAVLVGIIILSFISGKIIIDNTQRLNDELNNSKTNENMLQTKFKSLQTVNQEIGNSSRAVIDALPGDNSVLTTVNELQVESLPLGLSLSNLRSNSLSLNPNSPVISTEIDFDADGSYESMSSLIQTLKDIAPITRFDSIRINNQNSVNTNIYRLSAILIAYYAPLPLKIPSINEPLIKLTPDEESVLAKVTVLQAPRFLPSYLTATSSATTIGKSDPFSP